MTMSNSSYRKATLLLAAFFIISFTIMALDNHRGGYAASCPVCKAKSLFNNFQPAIVFTFYPTIAYHYFLQVICIIALPEKLSARNRAPPAF